MRCIDFDKEFERFVTAWLAEHAKEYKNYDAIEEKMPDIYEEFLDTPVNWLGGAKPGEYFLQYDQPKQLVNWMEDYMKQRVPVPDMLLNRISELGKACEDALAVLYRKERATQEMKMQAVTLLREIDSSALMDEYIALQAARGEKEDELADNALESLDEMLDAPLEKMRAALKTATPSGREALLTLLCNYPGNDEVFEAALALLEETRVNVAVVADCLGKLGDERALPLLKARAGSEETGYLDYIELRNAIEILGGEAPEREFDAEDPEYEAMRKMQ